jgi:hypothetical protein
VFGGQLAVHLPIVAALLLVDDRDFNLLDDGGGSTSFLKKEKNHITIVVTNSYVKLG